MNNLKDFENWLSVNRISPSTVNMYVSYVNKFLNQIEEITEESITKYLSLLMEKYSNTTINTHLASIKKYVEFKKIDIKLPKQFKIDKKIPDIITEKFFKDEVLSAIEREFVDELPIKALMYFMFYAGVRRHELLFLKRKDFDLKNKLVKVTDKKTKKERISTYNEETSIVLDKYFEMYEEEESAFNLQKIRQIDYIFQRLKPYFEDIDFRPCLLRHSCATNMLESGMSINNVGRLLGHASLNSTLHYVQLTDKQAIEEYQKKVK